MLYNPYGQGGASLSVNFYTATNPGGVSPLLRRQNLPGQLPNPNGPFTSAQPTRPRSFMITVVFPSVPSFSTVQTSSYLFVALQTQPVTAASPAGTANSVVYSTGSPRNSISLTAGYGAVTISENAADVSRPSSQSDSPARTPSSIPQLPAAPQDMTPDAPEAQVEAVTAFFAAEDSRGDAEVAAVVSDNAVTGEIAKLAVVVAGLWGSIYQKEPAQVRKPVVCTA